MTYSIRQVGSALVVTGLMVSLAVAQAPRSSTTSPAPSSSSATHSGHQSVIRHNPWPYQPARGSSDYGYRNPGGAGRSAEYYPPGDRFQNDSPRNITAQIGNGGQPDRQEQIQAFNAGTARYSALQSHIDRYAQPFGYGYGFGMGYGFGVR